MISLPRLFSGFVSIEKIYETLETVFHRLSKHLEFRQNGASYFQLSSQCLDIPMKHCLSCLITSKPESASFFIAVLSYLPQRRFGVVKELPCSPSTELRNCLLSSFNIHWPFMRRGASQFLDVSRGHM